jgi:signal transduction histidine kinase
MKEQHNLQIEIHASDDFVSLPDHMRVTLFQAVRELLFNVVKHAGVLRATVAMDRMDGHGQITISDSGAGFDVHPVLADPQAAHGLLIIRNRLSLMGGNLTVESVRGDGTRAKIEFPLTPSSR